MKLLSLWKPMQTKIFDYSDQKLYPHLETIGGQTSTESIGKKLKN